MLKMKVANRNSFESSDCNILATELDLDCQKTIKQDINRTRSANRAQIISFEEYLERFLTYYCKSYKVPYKQGLNEICAPFVLLKSNVRMSLSISFDLFAMFVEFFIPNFYREEEFFCLKSALGLLNLLVKYHLPKLFLVLDKCLVSPDIYATGWILTLFANKCSLEHVYTLWDRMVMSGDSLYYFFIIVAILEYNQAELLNIDSTQIAQCLGKFAFKEKETVDQIAKLANKIKAKTPASFYLFARQLGISNKEVDNFEVLYNYYKPHQLICLPLFPSEIIYASFENISCPDFLCIHFQRSINRYKKENVQLVGDCFVLTSGVRLLSRNVVLSSEKNNVG